MRKLIIITLIVLAVCPVQAAKTDVGQLTLDEKIGQMMQLVTDIFGTNDAQGVFHIDQAKADTLFSKYKIGSILNAPNTCAPTAQQWEEIMGDIQKLSMKHIGIPCVFGLDQNHGSTYTQQCGCYVQSRHCTSVCRGYGLRDSCCQRALDFLPYRRPRTRRPLASYLGEFWRGLLSKC